MKSKKIIVISAIFVCLILVSTQSVLASVKITGRIINIAGSPPDITLFIDLDGDGEWDITIELTGVSDAEFEALEKAMDLGLKVTMEYHQNEDGQNILDKVILCGLVPTQNMIADNDNSGIIFS